VIARVLILFVIWIIITGRVNLYTGLLK